MSVQKITRTVPETTETVTESVTCDRCGEVVKYASVFAGHVEWGVAFGVNNTAVFHKRGSVYPGEGSGTYERYDICAKCMREWLMPLIEKETGVPCHETEWDF